MAIGDRHIGQNGMPPRQQTSSSIGQRNSRHLEIDVGVAPSEIQYVTNGMVTVNNQGVGARSYYAQWIRYTGKIAGERYRTRGRERYDIRIGKSIGHGNGVPQAAPARIARVVNTVSSQRVVVVGILQKRRRRLDRAYRPVHSPAIAVPHAVHRGRDIRAGGVGELGKELHPLRPSRHVAGEKLHVSTIGQRMVPRRQNISMIGDSVGIQQVGSQNQLAAVPMGDDIQGIDTVLSMGVENRGDRFQPFPGIKHMHLHIRSSGGDYRIGVGDGRVYHHYLHPMPVGVRRRRAVHLREKRGNTRLVAGIRSGLAGIGVGTITAIRGMVGRRIFGGVAASCRSVTTLMGIGRCVSGMVGGTRIGCRAPIRLRRWLAGLMTIASIGSGGGAVRMIVGGRDRRGVHR